jgi:HPr kinase/phosphorylase
MHLHASCAVREGSGVLLTGQPGSGKSDLLLRLLDRGFGLVADDRVVIEDGCARPAAALAGLIEVRGLGLLRLPHVASARLVLVVQLDGPPERLPLPETCPALGLPMIRLDARAASAPVRVAWALDCALGRTAQLVGAFAA